MGSLHYPLNTTKGALYSRLERTLMNRTDLFLFESAFARTPISAHGRPRARALRVQRVTATNSTNRQGG